jgi:hypothetical protein
MTGVCMRVGALALLKIAHGRDLKESQNLSWRHQRIEAKPEVPCTCAGHNKAMCANRQTHRAVWPGWCSVESEPHACQF